MLQNNAFSNNLTDNGKIEVNFNELRLSKYIFRVQLSVIYL